MNVESKAQAVTLMTAGECSCAALTGTQLLWMCALDGGTWTQVADLPKGIVADDVASLAPSRFGCTLVTKSGDLHEWVRMGNSAAWRARGNLSQAGAQ